MEEKIKEVFSDEEFVKSFCALKTPEEAQAALAEKGIDVTIDELMTFADLAQKKAAGELTDADLASVAGGSVLAGLAIVAGSFVVGFMVSAASYASVVSKREMEKEPKV